MTDIYRVKLLLFILSYYVACVIIGHPEYIQCVFMREYTHIDLYIRRGVHETRGWRVTIGYMRMHNNLFRALLLRTTAVGPGPVAVKCAWVSRVWQSHPLLCRHWIFASDDGITIRVDETFLR